MLGGQYDPYYSLNFVRTRSQIFHPIVPRAVSDRQAVLDKDDSKHGGISVNGNKISEIHGLPVSKESNMLASWLPLMGFKHVPDLLAAVYHLTGLSAGIYLFHMFTFLLWSLNNNNNNTICCICFIIFYIPFNLTVNKPGLTQAWVLRILTQINSIVASYVHKDKHQTHNMTNKLLWDSEKIDILSQSTLSLTIQRDAHKVTKPIHFKLSFI